MNTNYYRNESWIDNTFSSKGKRVLSLLAVVTVIGMIAGGCGLMQNAGDKLGASDVTPQANAQRQETVSLDSDSDNSVSFDVDDEPSAMVNYDVASVGRSDPFMPSGELKVFEEVKNATIAEANEYNAKVKKIESLKNTVIRQPDDISPYSFNLPVPPTSLAPADSAAARITQTKVVGIMYNAASPSAIINVDGKDYLVRSGDKILDQEYKVLQINKSWITVGLGSNVYSASIGEMFSKDEFNKSKNDLYNLKSRFGGRKG